MANSLDVEHPEHPEHPGTIIKRRYLKPMKLTQGDLAEALGISLVRLNAIICCRRSITPDTAMRLGKVLGTDPREWLEMQLDFDLHHALRSPSARSVVKLKRLRRSDA